ncbi:hypothetical protein KA996_03235, partial [bacterium]|nr:hypothetical protein [bacterium]
EPVKPETVKISLNTVEVVQAPVITEDDTVFEWSPVLELNTEYTVKVLDGVEDKAGNVMKTEDGHEWLFKTSAYNIYPVVNFYKVLIPLTKEPLCDSAANAFNNSSNFEVIDKLTTLAVAGTITCDAGAKTVKFVPATQFAKDGNYTIKIKSNTQYSDSSTIGAVDLIMDFHFEMIIDDDFESGSAGWEMENNWEIGVPNYNAFGYKVNTAHSGTKVMATGLMDDHLVDTSYSTTGKNTFEIKEYDQYYIEFRAYVGLDDYGNKNNGMDVKIIEDGVVKVESVLLNLPNGEDLFGVYYLGTVAQSHPGIRGKSVDNTYSLFEGAVQGAVSTPGKKFSLSFVLNSDYDYAKAGIYLDDVKLYKTVF